MSLRESKKILAKLLAEESIIVEERNTANKEAFFDVENRLLVIPAFNDEVSNDVVDLMISHEVGHALITSNDVWQDAIIEKKINKTILNVVEDKRVEDHIKRRYPGLKPIFVRGYKELMQKDFFGLSKVDIDEINLADKINLYTKVGFIPGIEFDEEEQAILDRVENVSTFDDVIAVADSIQQHMRKTFSIKFKTNKDDLVEYYHDSIGIRTSEFSGSQHGYAPIVNGSSLPIETLSNFSEEDPEPEHIDHTLYEKDEEELILDFDEMYEKCEANYLKSKTDINFKANQTFLYDDNTITSVYVDIPDIKTKDCIVHYKEIYDRLSKEVYSYDTLVTSDEFDIFKAQNNATVNYLLKEFRLKKNAVIRRKIRESKTGDININKLYSYKVNNDIFKKAIKVPKEQSHSMIFFLDWSSSMQKVINGTIKQLLALVMFCRKQNIPFEVYAFSSVNFRTSDDNYYNPKQRAKTREMVLSSFSLFNLLSSKMTNTEFTKAANILLQYKHYNFYDNNGNYVCASPRWFWLGSTPLNHTIIMSRQISEEYKVKTGTDIVNNIFLTDGESHSILFKYDENNFDNLNSDYFNVYLRDRKRGLTQKVKKANFGETNSCLDIVKQSSDIRVFGLRIIDYKELKSKCFDLFGEWDYKTYWSMLKKGHALKVGNNSYDEFYIIKPTDNVDEDTEYSMPEKMTTAAIAKAFSKAINNRIENKVFLNKFISFIS